MADYLLGIDNGGTVSKVVIFDAEGREIQSASRKADAEYPRPKWVQRSMERVWQSTAEAIREALALSGINPRQIAAIGNTGHGNGIYPLDKQGNPLRPGILSVDRRADDIAARWHADGTDTKLWKITFQHIWGGQTAALLRWMKDSEPEVYAKLGAVLGVKDYVKYMLTGVIATDFTDISEVNLLDLRRRAYSDELMALYGIEDATPMLPDICETTDIVGRVTPEAAAVTGLAVGTPVGGGIFDCSGAAFGAGVIESGQACIIAGTWSINEIITDNVVDDPRLFMNTLHVAERGLLIESSPTSASNLEWFVTHFCAEEYREAERRGVSVYDILNEQVESLSPEGTSVLFHPFLFASNVGPEAMAGFYGVGGWHTKAHLVRAVYEGIVFSHLTHIERLRASGVAMDVVRLTGGGARSEVWTQMFSDAIQVPMEIVSGRELGARGAALAAGIGVGMYRDFEDAVQQAVRVERRQVPNPDATAYYEARYREYMFLVESLHDAWTRLNALNQ